jgi:hypothetical protein
MIRQQDVEGISVGDRALASLVNARGSKYCVAEGRPGTLLDTPANIGVTITNAWDADLNEAFNSGGEIYEANGDIVPGVGDIVMVYGEGDTTDDAFETAKGSAARKYDMFEVVNNASGSEEVAYIGNLRSPVFPGYGDTTATELTAYQSGTTITITSGPSLDPEVVGNYWVWYSGGNSRNLIKEWTDATHIEVERSETVSSESMCHIQLKTNASLPHDGHFKVIRLAGDRVYIKSMDNTAMWSEVPFIGEDIWRPADTYESKIFTFGDDAVIMNAAGQFRVCYTEEGFFFWKMNSPLPTVKISDAAKTGESKHRYRYVYSGAMLWGGLITKDRYNGDEGVKLLQQTGPVERNTDNIDYGDVYTVEPIGDASTTYGKLTGAAITGTYAIHTGYSGTSDATITLVVNSTSYSVESDLTGCENMADVAAKMEDATRVYKDLSELTWEWDDDHFVLKAGEGDTISACTAGSASGTDMATNMGLTSGSGAAATTPTYTTKRSIGTLTLPSQGNHLTHYAVFRSPDFFDGNKSGDLLAWVGDIPVAKAFTGSVSGSTLTLTIGTLEVEDEGCVLTDESGNTITISTLTDSSTATISESATYASRSWTLGGGTVFTAHQSGSAITIDSGLTLAESSHKGYLIFWADGGVSLVKSVTNGSAGVAGWEADHNVQAATIKPVSRTFTDTVSDDELEERIIAWPLPNRYQVPLEEGSVNCYCGGMLFSGMRGGSKYTYGDASEKYLAGYYSEGHQYDDTIHDGLQSFTPETGHVTIRGSVKTYKQSLTSAMYVGENRVGESVRKLYSPEVVDSSIGTIGDGGLMHLESGAELVVTNEPEVRIFDGSQYLDGYAKRRIKESELNKAKPAYITAYHRSCGAFIWFKQDVSEARVDS